MPLPESPALLADLSKTADVLAGRSPLLDRRPLRVLGQALKYSSYKQACALAYPAATTAQRTRLAIKLAAVLLKQGGAMSSSLSAGCAPGSAAMSAPRVTMPMTYSGPPGAAATQRFGR